MSANRLSGRALCIVAGLARSGRIAVMPPGSMTWWRGYARLDRVGGDGFYWIAADGSVLKRGSRYPGESDDLAPGFVQAMARLGDPRAGMEIPASSPQSALAKICA